ncbi:MAG: hypothetical protein ACE141_17080 [Bryobacteraceae bacterium]
MDSGFALKVEQAFRRSPQVRLLLAAPLVATLGLAAFMSLKTAYADYLFREGSPSAVARARRMLAANAAFFQDDPRDRTALEHAVARNPRYAAGWVNLGLLAEIEGDIPRAERLLLEAARIDRTYEPRWTLANFYFRQGDQDKFWHWARKAAEMAYQDQTPLFQLCWRISQDPAVILTRAIPDRPAILAQYLNYLLLQGKVAESEPVADRLIAATTDEGLPLLVSYCEQLIRAGRMTSAVRAWNTLCARRRLPYEALDPLQARSLTNGAFSVPPLSAGFDWRLQLPDGVFGTRVSSMEAFRFSFSGSQPERCQLLSQVLPVEASRRYRLVYEFRMKGIPSPSGLRWYVSDLADWKEVSATPLEPSGDSWSRGALDFVAPSGDRGVVLVLEYQRAHGSTRIEGDLWLRQLSLAFR